MVRIRCSRCGKLIIDTEKKKCYAMITWGATIKPSEIGFDIEYDVEESIVCLNCSHSVPLRKIRNKKWFDEVMYLIKQSKKYELPDGGD